MVEYTYQTRRKLTETWVNSTAERGRRLSKREKEMLPDVYGYTIPQEACNEMRKILTERGSCTLSGLYQSRFEDLVEVCVPKEYQEEFYYALDQMNQYQMTAGWYRRSLRSGSYAPFAEQSVRILRGYSRLGFYGAELADLLTGSAQPEFCDHARNEHFSYAEILAAQIDRGNDKTV